MDPSPQTLLALCAHALSGADRDLLVERDAAGAWRPARSQAVRERIAHIALGLRAAGIGVGDRVAIMAPNCVDWIVVNLAILHAGGITVPLYATQAHDQVRHILLDSGARLLFVDTAERRASLARSGIALPRTIAFEASVDGDDLAALEIAGRRCAAIEPDVLAAIAARVAPDDLAMLIYTSGTTGRPKGVMLTHRNIASNAVDAFASAADYVQPGDAVLSILPYAHIYESTNIYGYLLCGSVVYVNSRSENLLDDLRTVRPAMLLAVPRVFERVLVGIVSRAKSAGGVRAKIVPWALAAGRDYMRAKSSGKAIDVGLGARYALARKLALVKIKPLLGLQKLRVCASGSAPLHTDIAFTFMGFGVSIAEGYGLTECSPVVTVNEPLKPAIGTVGSAIANVELKLAPDGELLVRGPGVMKGYYRDAEATNRAMRDGWLHTGDIATIRADGCIRIVDRKTELFKTSGGKYIAPARLESAMLRSLYFNQVVVLGAGRPHPVALVAPNWNALRSELHLPAQTPPAQLACRPDVKHFLATEAQQQTSDLAPFERIRTIAILPRDLSIEDGELSPTQKIKRRVVLARYERLLDTPTPVLA